MIQDIYESCPPRTQPREGHIGTKIQFIVEWPMSVLRWISVPPCYYVCILIPLHHSDVTLVFPSLQDGQWTKWHYSFAVISPMPMIVILVIATSGWSGFYAVWLGKLPLFVFLAIIGRASPSPVPPSPSPPPIPFSLTPLLPPLSPSLQVFHSQFSLPSSCHTTNLSTGSCR